MKLALPPGVCLVETLVGHQASGGGGGVVSHVFSSQPTKARNRVQRGGGEGGKKMESESGMGTEGDSGNEKEMPSDLRGYLGKLKKKQTRKEMELAKKMEDHSTPSFKEKLLVATFNS